MTTPISNNNPGSIANNQSARLGKREGKEPETPAAEQQEEVSGRSDGDVKLSRAAEILSQSQVQRGESAVQTPEQAAQLAQQLKNSIQADPAAALAGQTHGVSESILDLLKAG